MTKLVPEWVRTSDPVIRSTAPPALMSVWCLALSLWCQVCIDMYVNQKMDVHYDVQCPFYSWNVCLHIHSTGVPFLGLLPSSAALYLVMPIMP